MIYRILKNIIEPFHNRTGSFYISKSVQQNINSNIMKFENK